jgi:integrase
VCELPLGEARKRTASYRALAADGIDPRRPRPEPNQLLTYEQVVHRFIEQWAQPRQRTWRDTQNVLLRSFAPWLKKLFADITKQDARTIIRGFIDAGHKYKAAHAIAWVRKLWRWAAGEDLVSAPIMDSLGIHIDKAPRDRWFNDAEVASIWKAADACTDPGKAAYFKILLLTASRKSALANMRWSDIKDDVWVTPHEFTKTSKSAVKKRTYHTPLPPLAQRILKGLPHSEGDDRVFSNMPIEPSERYAKELVRHGAPPDFSYHQVRHSVATWLQNNGASEYEIGLILNHSGSGVTAGYSHGTPLKLKLELLTRWADHIEKLVTPEGAVLLR